MKKSTLEREYLQNKLSIKKIAEKYNISTRKVYNSLIEYNVPRRKNYKQSNLGEELTLEQEKFVYAKVLGDGCITKSKHHATYHFEFSHEEKQRNYAIQCAAILDGWGRYCEKVRNRDPKIYKKNVWTECTFKSVNHQEFSRIYRHFYENGRKIVNKEILSMVDDFGLAIWYMDDGHKDSRMKAGYLNTLCFTKQENEMIVEWLKNTFGINSNIVKAGKSRNGRDTLYRIRFSAGTWDKFVSIVEKYIVDDLKYKIGKDTVQS
jgi:hypothetical protein